MEVIPWLYAHSKYMHYLPAVVYGSYTMAVVTPQFAQLADSGLRCIYYRGAFDLYSSHSTTWFTSLSSGNKCGLQCW